MRVQPNNSNSVTIAALVKTPNICHSHYRNAQWGKGQILCQRALKWIWIVGWKWVCGFLFVGDAKPGPVSPPFPSDFYFKFIYSFFSPSISMLLPVIRPLHSYSVSNYLLFILFFVFFFNFYSLNLWTTDYIFFSFLWAFPCFMLKSVLACLQVLRSRILFKYFFITTLRFSV